MWLGSNQGEDSGAEATAGRQALSPFSALMSTYLCDDRVTERGLAYLVSAREECWCQHHGRVLSPDPGAGEGHFWGWHTDPASGRRRLASLKFFGPSPRGCTVAAAAPDTHRAWMIVTAGRRKKTMSSPLGRGQICPHRFCSGRQTREPCRLRPLSQFMSWSWAPAARANSALLVRTRRKAVRQAPPVQAALARGW